MINMEKLLLMVAPKNGQIIFGIIKVYNNILLILVYGFRVDNYYEYISLLIYIYTLLPLI